MTGKGRIPGGGKDIVMDEYREMTGQELFVVDLNGVCDRKGLHDRIQEALPLPDYYGRNLDALYDTLTEFGSGWKVVFTGCGLITESLPAYMDALKRLCRQAQEELEDLTVTFED